MSISPRIASRHNFQRGTVRRVRSALSSWFPEGPPDEAKPGALIFGPPGGGEGGTPSKAELEMRENIRKSCAETPPTIGGQENIDQVREDGLEELEHTLKQIDCSHLLHQIKPKLSLLMGLVPTDQELISVVQRIADTPIGRDVMNHLNALIGLEAKDLNRIENCLEFLWVWVEVFDDLYPSDEPSEYKKRFVDELAQEQKDRDGNRGPPDESGTRIPWNKLRGGSAHFGGLLSGLAPPSPFPIDGTKGHGTGLCRSGAGSPQAPLLCLLSGDNTGA